MRILVEPSDYIIRNAGDMAMMHVAISRLQAMWPDAIIQVLSDAPDLLPSFCPGVSPLDSKGRKLWFTDGFLCDRLTPFLPKQILSRKRELERFLRRHWPSLATFILKRKYRNTGKNGKELRNFLEAEMKADLVIATGMGGITDAFPDYAFQLLDSLRLAMQRGAITVMVGQGIGPIEDPKLYAQAKSVLPRIDFISLREARSGGPLLRSLGVSSDRIFTTGDDAIEIAYKQYPQVLGNGLGVNLRAADYSGVNWDLVKRIKPILQTAARRFQAPMVPIPISSNAGESDVVTTKKLIDGYERIPDCGEDMETHFGVIKQISRCRVVVTGSYHAAVFALAQGISAIGLANSDYYKDKFLGLIDQFGTGCQVVYLHENELTTKITVAIEMAWQSAEQVRNQLLASAAKQVQQSHTAYQKIYELVNSRRNYGR